MNSLDWCIKQKNGIKLIEPSKNLSEAYLKKVKNAIISLNNNIKEDNFEWVVVSAYYARYFSVYALFMLCGIKCEIHDCTIKLFKEFFSEYFDEKLFEELEKSKGNRVNVQYYVEEETQGFIEDASLSKEFALKVEETINKFNDSDISKIREKLK